MNTETERPERDIREALEGLAGEAPPPRGIDRSLVRRGRRRLGAALVAALAATSLLVYGGSLAATRLGTSNPQPAAPTACTWSVVPSDNQDPSRYNNSIQDITVVSETDAWAVGTYSPPGEGSVARTLILHWNGAAWSVVSSPNVGAPTGPGGQPTYLAGVAAISSDDVWAVGYSENSPLTLHWDGRSWTSVPVPRVEAPFSHLFGVSAISSDDVWAVGNYAKPDERGGTLALHWDGSRWSIVPTPDLAPPSDSGLPYDSLNAVAARAPDDVWAVGVSGNVPQTSQVTLVEHWDGTRWSLVTSQDIPPRPGTGGIDNMLNDVATVSPSAAWAAGSYEEAGYSLNGPSSGRPLLENWDGRRWSTADLPDVGTGYLNGVTALSPEDAWAVGATTDVSAGTSDLLLLHWDGSSWSRVAGPVIGASSSLSSVAPAGSGLLAMGARDDQAGAQYTTLGLRCEVSG